MEGFYIGQNVNIKNEFIIYFLITINNIIKNYPDKYIIVEIS